MAMNGLVTAVARSASHEFSKTSVPRIHLLAGQGVEDDAHRGTTVQHLSRIVRDPTQPNLRQVHLIHAELHDELAARGFDVGPSDMGAAVLDRDTEGTLIRKAGAMAIVIASGPVSPGDVIHVALPAGPHRALMSV